MSAPPVPRFGASLAAVARFQWMRHLRSKKLRLAASALVVVVLAALVARYAREDATAETTFRTVTSKGFFGFLVYLLPFLFQAGAIGEEVEARTFAFLAARPAGRFAITLGKFVAGAALSSALLGLGLLVLYAGCFATETSAISATMPLLGWSLLSLVVLSFAYGAITLFFGGVAPDAGGVLGIVYLGLFEFLGASMPYVFRLGSLNFHATEAAGLERTGLMIETVPTLPKYASLGIVGVAALVALSLSSAVVARSEYRFSQA